MGTTFERPTSLLVSFRQRHEIHLLAWLVLALDLEERERAQRLGAAARAPRAGGFMDRAAIVRTVHGDQGVGGMVGQRGREVELFRRRATRDREIRCAELLDE